METFVVEKSVEPVDHQPVEDVITAVEKSPIQPPSPDKQCDSNEDVSGSPPINKDSKSTDIVEAYSMPFQSSSLDDVESVVSEKEKQGGV